MSEEDEKKIKYSFSMIEDSKMSYYEKEYIKLVTERRWFYMEVYSSIHTSINSEFFSSRRLQLNFLDSLVPYKSLVEASGMPLKKEVMLYGYLSTICNFYEYILQEINYLFDLNLLDIKSHVIVEENDLAEKTLLERIIDGEYTTYWKVDFVFEKRILKSLDEIYQKEDNQFRKDKVNKLIQLLNHDFFQTLKVLRNNHFHGQNLFGSDFRVYNPNKKLKVRTIKPLGPEKAKGEEKAIIFLNKVYYKYIEILKCICDIEFYKYMQVCSDIYLCLSFSCSKCGYNNVLSHLITKKLLNLKKYDRLMCLNCYKINEFSKNQFPKLIHVFFKNDFDNNLRLNDKSRKTYNFYVEQ